MTVSQEFTQRLYEQAAARPTARRRAAPAGASQPSDDDVVDAEIVDDAATSRPSGR